MRKSPTKYTEEDFNKVKKLMTEGYSIYRAARVVGMGHNVAYYHLRPEFKKKQGEAIRRWRDKNKDRIRRYGQAYQTQYRKLHPDRVKKYRRLHYERHREEHRIKVKKYKKLNPEKTRSYDIKRRDKRRLGRLRIRALAEHYKAIINGKTNR